MSLNLKELRPSEQIESIKDPEEKLIFRLIYEVCLNPIEIISLKKQDLDLKKNLIKIKKQYTKNKIKKVIKISKELSNEIKYFIKPQSNYLFKTKKSPKLSLRTFHRIIKKYSMIWKNQFTSGKIRKLGILKKINNSEDISSYYKRFDYKKPLSNKDLIKININNESRSSIITDIILETGITLEELRKIKIKDFNKNNKTLKIDNKRIIFLSNELSNKIEKYAESKETENYLISNKNDPFTKSRLLQIIKDLKKRIHLKDLSFRSLRYTSIYKMFQKNISLIEIKKRTNIKNISSIHLYGSLMISYEKT